MFKYNTLSDIIGSDRLVTPLRKEGDRILCLNENGEEVYYNFDDFDFDKTPGERQKIEVVIEEPEEPEEKIVIIDEVTSDNKVVVSAGRLRVRSCEIKSKDELYKVPSGYFVKDLDEKKEILESAGYGYKNLRNINVYVEGVDIK